MTTSREVVLDLRPVATYGYSKHQNSYVRSSGTEQEVTHRRVTGSHSRQVGELSAERGINHQRKITGWCSIEFLDSLTSGKCRARDTSLLAPSKTVYFRRSEYDNCIVV